MGGLGGEGLDLRKGAHPDADRARHTASCVGCEKNNGSAVETTAWRDISEGRQKTHNINGLARAAFEREEQVREYRVRSRDIGQFSGRPYRKAAGAAGAQVWRR